jgi:hypothetical protein
VPIAPPKWTDAELDADRMKAIAQFREVRMREPLEEYLERFDEARDAFEELMEATVDFTKLEEKAVEILQNEPLLHALRYLAGPPISKDDLATLADAKFSRRGLSADPGTAKRIVDTVLFGFDRERFPWIGANGVREPEEDEKKAAILASAALMATQRVATKRRNESKKEQEELVRQTLLDNGYKEVERRTARRLEEAPKAGEFCMESTLGSRKADLIVGLWDDRTMPIECKVSNSSTNSIKRLNNDAAVKARQWVSELGNLNVVPAAVLSGVFKLRNLRHAEDDGLALFWAHDLAALVRWLESTK